MRYQSVLVGLLIGLCSMCANAQDLYDTTVLRTFNITFQESNWQQILRNNYSSETLLVGDLEIDGDVYPDVGVRIRGNSSYFGLPSGSEKFSLKIKMDFVDGEQDLMGYDTLNLNNSFHDPTFCREVVYNNFVAQYIPNPRANHAVVTINGENWGVYVNVQQPDKRMLRDYFTNADGLRIKCANSPNGPGLRYVGTNPSSYNGYEIQNDGGYADPVGVLIDTCNAITNGSLGSWENDIDSVFAIDSSIWSVVLENMLSDDDSYVNKGCDFMTYQDPIDGRMHLLQRDANETFTDSQWAVTKNFNSSSKPILSHILDVPDLRQRYMAHYRTAFENCDWAYFEPQFTALRNLIDAEVQADPKRLYTYANFTNNFTNTVNLPGGGFSGGPVIGLEQFFNERVDILDNNAEMLAAGPAIASVDIDDDSPDPADDVWITATVAPNGNPIAQVKLYYRPIASQTYQHVQMNDDGLSQDGSAGDGVYGVMLPVVATAGQQVSYYVAATADNTYSSLSFEPALSERAPLSINYTFGAEGGMRISEWMYSGDSGEFIEFTNMSDISIDMTGWSFDDVHGIAEEFDLSAFSLVAPGESVIVTDSVADSFRTAWGLDAGVQIIGELGEVTGNNLGRNDQIILFNAAGDIVDRLDYGDGDYEGTIRTKDATGQTCRESLGQNDVSLWILSESGDQFGSFAAVTGEFGTPGSYNAPSCDSCPADMNGDGDLNFFDVSAFLQAFGSSDSTADFTGDGAFNFFDISAFLTAFSAGCP